MNACFEGANGDRRAGNEGTIGHLQRPGDPGMNACSMSRRLPDLRRLALACALACHAVARAAAPDAPAIFAPGTISATGNVDAVTFSPDGDWAWFDEVAGGGSTIVRSHRVGGVWTPPEIASFSGEWRDLDPALAPDGSFIVFCSNRPLSAGGPALDAKTFDGRVRAGQGSHLWRVDRVGSGWGEPVPLPAVVNDDTRIYSPSVVRDGSIYFQHPDAESRTFHLMRSQLRDGVYQRPVPVVVGPRQADERDPAVAPDESFMVFSARLPAGKPEQRLVIAFRAGDGWGEPVDLGDGVNHDGAEGPHLGPDGRTVYFDSTATFAVDYPRTRIRTLQDLQRARLWDNGNSHLWSLSLAPWIDAHAH